MDASKLEGFDLEQAVDIANGGTGYRWVGYTDNWEIGGPIIERERIELFCFSRSGKWVGEWQARCNGQLPLCTGPTPLIAAMRAFVASKAGKPK